jgi:hypothetical protein
VDVQIKHWRQPSNPLKIAYPLLHPSYLRRNGARWLETHPEVVDRMFTKGYGIPIHYVYENRQKRIEYYRKIGILKRNWFYMDMKDAVNADVEELVRIMGKK